MYAHALCLYREELFYYHFHKNVTYLLHGGAVGVRIKQRKRVKIGQTIRFGSDDF